MIEKQQCPHCAKEIHAKYLERHVKTCIYNPPVGDAVRQWMRANPHNGNGVGQYGYIRKRPSWLPSEYAIRLHFSTWRDFVTDFCGMSAPCNGRARGRTTSNQRMCDCGHVATHFDVVLHTGNHTARYDLCNDCYDLELK